MSNSPAVNQQGMTPREIRAEMVRLGVKVSDIARRAGVTHSAVSQTIYQYEYSLYKGRRIRPYIASAIGREVSEIWPDDAA